MHRRSLTLFAVGQEFGFSTLNNYDEAEVGLGWLASVGLNVSVSVVEIRERGR